MPCQGCRRKLAAEEIKLILGAYVRRLWQLCACGFFWNPAGDFVGLTWCNAGTCCPSPTVRPCSRVNSEFSHEFARYTELMLQDHLARDADLVRCPKPTCQFPVLKDPTTTMVICQNPKCKFT